MLEERRAPNVAMPSHGLQVRQIDVEAYVVDP